MGLRGAVDDGVGHGKLMLEADFNRGKRNMLIKRNYLPSQNL